MPSVAGVTMLRAGINDLLAYTDETLFPRGISPLRSGFALTPVEMTLKTKMNTSSFL